MMMFPRSLASLACLVLALGLAVSVPSHARPERGAPKLEHALEALELDAETRSAVSAVIDAARPSARALRDELSEAYTEMRELMANPEPSEEALLAQVDVLSTLRAELRKHEIRTLFAVGALLTPEQREQVREALKGSRGKGCDRGYGKRHGKRARS
jgi:Spy/CpxP family protein refolding chaperone